jgi:hypothetical protein
MLKYRWMRGLVPSELRGDVTGTGSEAQELKNTLLLRYLLEI